MVKFVQIIDIKPYKIWLEPPPGAGYPQEITVYGASEWGGYEENGLRFLSFLKSTLFNSELEAYQHTLGLWRDRLERYPSTEKRREECRTAIGKIESAIRELETTIGAKSA